MQQTETYKLNLIETSDPFSPNPLNENAEKTEAAIEAARAEAAAAAAAGDDAVRAEAAAAHDALEQRVVTLEGKHVVGGTYKGTGSGTQTIELGFTPQVVFIYESGTSGWWGVLHRGTTSNSKIVEGGFSVLTTTNQHFNTNGNTYSFIAAD